MRRFFPVTLLALWLLPLPVHAEQMKLSWTACAGVAGYRIYESLDAGKTWTVIADFTSQPLPTSTLVEAEEGQLVLYRVSAYNATGETPQHIQRVEYDSALLP